MPVLTCPRCQRVNPESASFCYFDGMELKPGAGASLHRLAREFVFPAGRRCQTFDEFAQACQDEWPAARDLLKKGLFAQYFGGIGRLDLARAAQEAAAQADPDIALTAFVGALPVSRAHAPQLDLNPRRILLGNMLAGETRQVQLAVSNQGQGTLQGTLKITDGNEWLKLTGAADGQCAIRTPRDQQINLEVDTRKLPAAQTYGAMLTVVTNGGVVEVPVRLDLVARPFPRSPFQGAKTPRDMAVLMRGQPKAAVPLLESGEIGRWFQSNGWSYPIRGAPARGVAGVQQFFEAMGLSKPPAVQISQPEMTFTCHYAQNVRGQISIQTRSKKWVYATIESDSPWLRVLTPQVSGPQHAAIGFEVDSRQVAAARAEGKLNIVANAGQALALRVGVELRGGPRRAGGRGVFQPLITMALAFLLLRLFLSPLVDFIGRGVAARAADDRNGNVYSEPLSHVGGWLALPWDQVLFGAPQSGFRHAFVSYFVRIVVLGTFWLGAIWGAVVMLRRGGAGDLSWGIIAGVVTGLAVMATLACAFLILDSVPLALWGLWGGGNVGLLLVWVLLAVTVWGLMGAAAGLLLGAIGPLRRLLVAPVQSALAGLCRLCGLRGLATYCAPA